jgi:hypothetical protein
MLSRIVSSIYELFNDIKYLVFNKEVILIYQMGKVGSSSISKSLKNSGIYSIHTHRLNTTYPFTTKFQKIYQSIRAGVLKVFLHRKKIKLITLTREPISRNISGFFQNLEDFIGKNEKDKNELIKLFFKSENNYYTINWFDNEIKSVFGIDVYSYEFPKDKGFMVISDKNVEMFIARIEDLNSLENQIGNFLKIKEFKLDNTNKGENKWYSEMYDQLKSNINFPESYVKDRYNSKYMKHFYSEQEISLFKEKLKILENKIE